MIHAPKANELLKHNIDALLDARRQSRSELARWCKRSRSWLDKAFSEDRRMIPVKYLDRIADFFGIATYQLLQPGISPLLERRGGRDRRSGRERRISNASAAAQPRTAIDLMDVIRAMSPESQRKAIPLLTDILNDDLRGLRRQQAIRAADDEPGRTDGTTGATQIPRHGKKAPTR